MSRFKDAHAVLQPAPVVRFKAREPIVPVTAIAASVADSSLLQQTGFAVLCIFAISAYANEFATRLFHVKAYISTVSWVILPLLLLLSGNLTRAFKDPIGRLWAFFLAWTCLAVPFSAWKGGSVALLADYIPHGWIQLCYFAAFAISLRHLRRLLLFLIAANALLLVDCWWGGSMQTGRLEIPDSMFFRNANDLSLQLIVAITQFSYLLYQRQRWKRVAGAAAMLAALIFLLETGARGGFVAALVLAVVAFTLAKNRMGFAVVGVPLACGALILAPSSVLHRVTLIPMEPETVAPEGALDQAALASQTQRLALLKQSLSLAITHPVFGVGPGQFAVAASGELTREGKPAPWLGTHNSYTEVASECGIPAFLAYAIVLFLVLRSNLRIYRRAGNLAGGEEIRALAFSLFSGALMYAISTAFFHIAYSSYLPMIAGLSVALRLAVDRNLWTSYPRASAA